MITQPATTQPVITQPAITQSGKPAAGPGQAEQPPAEVVRHTEFAVIRGSEGPAEPIQPIAAPPVPAGDDVRPAFEPPPSEGPTLPAPTPVPSPTPAPPASKEPPAEKALANKAPLNAAPHPPGAAPPRPLPPVPIEDPHQRIAPTSSGSVLQLPPGKAPIEKALELSARLDVCCADAAALKQRVQALEEAVAARDRLMSGATRDFQEANAELARVRRELDGWAQDLKQQQTRIGQQDKEQQELLRTLIQTLEKAVGPDAPAPAPKQAGKP
jgi:hypothetical protein